MKKAISLLLALVLCLSLCACDGGENNTPNAPETTDATVQDTTARKNELLQTAEPFVYRDYYEDVWGNIVKAENTYKGKVFLMNAHVEEITESYVVINGIVVYLSTEEIMQMNTYDYAEVVGVIDEVGDIGSSVMYEAYLITTIYKETGSVTEISTLDGVSFPYYTINYYIIEYLFFQQ